MNKRKYGKACLNVVIVLVVLFVVIMIWQGLTYEPEFDKFFEPFFDVGE